MLPDRVLEHLPNDAADARVAVLLHPNAHQERPAHATLLLMRGLLRAEHATDSQLCFGAQDVEDRGQEPGHSITNEIGAWAATLDQCRVGQVKWERLPSERTGRSPLRWPPARAGAPRWSAAARRGGRRRSRRRWSRRRRPETGPACRQRTACQQRTRHILISMRLLLAVCVDQHRQLILQPKFSLIMQF